VWSLTGRARASGGLGRERKRRRQLAVEVGALLQLGRLRLGDADHVGAGDEAARRRFTVGQVDEGSSELGRVAELLPVLGLPPLELLRVALGVVLDRRLRVRG
jgi:hypothetical protein